MKNFPSIKKHSEYIEVSKKGRSLTSGPLVMVVKDNGTDGNRLGITISRRQGNSVVRHTFARKIRELFRQYDRQTVCGKDIVIIARNGIGNLSFDVLKKNYERLLSSHNILLEDPKKAAGREPEGKDLLN